MRSTFDKMMPVTFKLEGGYVNHPKDPGGPTNHGVTLKVFNAWRASHGLPQGVRALQSMSKDEAIQIYRSQYWDAIRGDELPLGLDYIVFDTCVNSGASKAAYLLQRTVDAKADKSIGNITLELARKHFAADEKGTIAEYCQRRLSWMQTLKTWKTFGKGWSNRVAQVQAKGIALARSDDDMATAVPVNMLTTTGAKANPEDVKLRTTPEGKSAVAIGTGTALGTTSELGQTLIEQGSMLSGLADYLPYVGIVGALLVVGGVAYLIYRQTVRRAQGAF